ncbi:MAG: type II toxin-antitoxin system VapC family toxin [Propionibacteriaceae bacterium]|jgi:predicted nucleic acid-binding protein|nr:type II toxin-antitoxin system VapC family toxin [Propionibacteriaceae bacterium]
MGLLLDTMVASELRKARHRSTDPNFAAWSESVRLDDAYLSVVTVYEMERGVLLIKRKDPASAAIYRTWLDDLEDAFRGRILQLTIQSAKFSAAFQVPVTAPFADSLIAGIAKENDLTIATRNTADFARFQVPLLNPWEPA